MRRITHHRSIPLVAILFLVAFVATGRPAATLAQDEEAIALLEACLADLQPDGHAGDLAATHEALGDAYAAAHRVEEARRQYGLASEWYERNGDMASASALHSKAEGAR